MSDIGCFHYFRLLIAFRYYFIRLIYYDCKLLVSLLQQGASVRKEQRLGQASSTDVAKKQGKQKRQNLDVHAAPLFQSLHSGTAATRDFQ